MIEILYGLNNCVRDNKSDWLSLGLKRYYGYVFNGFLTFFSKSKNVTFYCFALLHRFSRTMVVMVIIVVVVIIIC